MVSRPIASRHRSIPWLAAAVATAAGLACERIGLRLWGEWNAGYFIVPVGLGAYCGGFWAGIATVALLVGYSELRLHEWLAGNRSELMAGSLCVINLLISGVFASVLIGRLQARREKAEEGTKSLEDIVAVRAGLAAIVDSSEDAIISKTIDGVITSWNRGAEVVFGYSAKEAIGQKIAILMPPEKPDEEERILARLRRGEVVRHHETSRIRKDGRKIDIAVTISPVRDAKGRVVGAAKIARDITEEKRRIQALRRSEERYHATLDNIMEGCQLIGFDWRFLYVNAAAAVQNRRSGEEFIGKTMMEVWPGIETTQAFALLRRCMEERVRVHEAIPFTFPDGRNGWFDVRCQPVPEGIFVLSIDITDHKKADEDLAAERRLLRTLVDQLPDLIHVTGADGRLLLVNRAMAGCQGADEPTGLVGMSRRDLPNAALLGTEADELTVFSGNELVDREEVMETGGWSRTFLTSRLPMRGPDGTVLGAIGIARDVTRMKEMHVIAQRQAQILETMTEAAYALDAQWKFTFVNDRAEAIMGKRRHEVIGRPIWEMLPTLVGTPIQANYEEAMRERKAIAFEAYSPIAKHWVDFRLFPFGDGIAVFILDIQARKDAEASLRLFRVLMDRTRECIEVIDPVTAEVLDANEAACKQHGYTREEYLKLSVFDVHPSLSREEYEADVWKLRESGGMLVTGNHRRRDGTEFPVELSLNWVHLDRDYIVAVARDISERRDAEVALRQSEERFRQVVENIQEVFWMTDIAKGKILYISPGYERIWGRSCAALYESPSSWIEAIHPDDRSRIRERAMTLQASGEYYETYRIVRPDGSMRWVRDRAFPIRDERGTVTRIVGVAEDITASKKLEEQFLRSQRMEAVGTLSSGIAHDLNNILTPMLMVASMLESKVSDPADVELITQFKQSALRGANIVRQLLTFSRGVTVKRGIVQMRHLLREMSILMQETFPKELSITDHAPAQLWPVIADATQLHQVLMNLCVNARDAMPRGGQLSLSAQNVIIEPRDLEQYPQGRAGRFVAVSVRDTGEGIPLAHMSRIFEPFFTTKEVGKGTGLGLSTVLGIVKSHEGFLTVYSEMGRGSVFKVYIPADPDSVELPQAPALAAPRGAGELILLVDDESAIRATTKRVLEQSGYRVLTAADGGEGLALALRHREELRLVITDLMMPKVGGIALVRGLRESGWVLHTIAASGIEDTARRSELEALGVTEILSKPLTPAELLLAVRRQLAAT